MSSEAPRTTCEVGPSTVRFSSGPISITMPAWSIVTSIRCGPNTRTGTSTSLLSAWSCTAVTSAGVRPCWIRLGSIVIASWLGATSLTVGGPTSTTATTS
ncbi:MAG: hypothetical protein IPQ07_15170 [Myxococcales bacterium]|nr:hypothetical protein [Myxococcales bacterium]